MVEIFFIDSNGFKIASLCFGILCYLTMPFIWNMRTVGKLPGESAVDTSGSLFGFVPLKNNFSPSYGYKRTNSGSSNEFVETFLNSGTF